MGEADFEKGNLALPQHRWARGCINIAMPIGKRAAVLGQVHFRDAPMSEGEVAVVAFGEQVQSEGDIHLSGAAWRKSSWSAYNGACVEVARLRNGLMAVRDTKDAGRGPVLAFDAATWRSFVDGVKNRDAS